MRDPFLWPYSVWIHNCCGGANINLIFTPLFVIWCFIKINVSYSTGVPLPTADALPLNWLICPVFTSFLSNIFKHSAFSGTFQRTGLHSVYAEQTPQWGEKNDTWQREVGHLENITVGCDRRTHWQDVSMSKQGLQLHLTLPSSQK